VQFTAEGIMRDIAALDPAEIAGMRAREKWVYAARPNQIPPKSLEWSTLLWLAGRFYGKTRCLVEHGWFEAFRVPNLRVHALAPTIGDVRRTLFEGESGFLAKTPPELIKDYNRSLHEITFTNGSRVLGFSATEEAQRLRGPQCALMLFDEAAAADIPAGNLEIAYKTAVLGCRLPYPDGTPSRKLIATTPKPIPFLKSLMRRRDVIVVRGTSYENIKNVAPSIASELLSMEGTNFGRQELYGEFLDDTENAIFKRQWFRLWPAGKKLPEFAFVLMSMDTAMSGENYDLKNQTADFSACGVYGVFNTKQCFTEAELKKLNVKTKYAAVLCDFWMERLGFPELLEKSRETYRTKWGKPGHTPNVVLIENRQSGISLRQVLMQYGVPTWPYEPRGQSKTMRAHAASPLVLQGMLFIPESGLEDRKGQVRNWAEPMIEQMCTFSGEGSIEYDDALDQAVQAMLYLSERGTFHAEPQGRAYPDPDEKEEREQREAQRVADREKRGRHSAYGE